MEKNTVYIKIEQNNIVRNKKVFLEDIAGIYCSDVGIKKKLGKIVVLNVNDDKDNKYVFSTMKIIEMIHNTVKDIVVDNVGEPDFIISYETPKQKSVVINVVKVILVSLIVFFGGAFTIITFNQDVSVAKVFELIYKLFRAQSLQKYMLMEITYSIGLFVGIVVFFNHFSKKKTSVDPTPLQIELKTYEKDMNTTIIDNQSREGNAYDV